MCERVQHHCRVARPSRVDRRREKRFDRDSIGRRFAPVGRGLGVSLHFAHTPSLYPLFRHPHPASGTRPEKIRIQKWYTVYKDHITLADYEISEVRFLGVSA